MTLFADQDCSRIFGNSKNSEVYQISKGDLYSIEKSDEAISSLAMTLGCDPAEISVKNEVCKNMLKSDLYTRVCYVETNLGYFFITRDLTGTVNFIFNKHIINIF
jgi:hypothetical protein